MPEPFPEDPLPPNYGSVTIGGMPIAFDWQCQLRNFMRERLPGDDILFARWLQDEVPANPLGKGNATAYLATPYPPLPAIQVGELQWPSGASRYARGLYAVDWSTMLRIAKEAWGYELPTELIDLEGAPDDLENQREILPTDVPADWGIDHYPIRLVINDGQHMFEADMFALPPYRVTGQGIDLWLIPLVDERFLYNRRPHTAGNQPEDWEALIDALAGDMDSTIAIDPIDSAYASPDYRLWKVDNPAAELLDVAALSVGLRIVRDPLTGQLRAISAADSNTRRENALASESLLLSGGKRGNGARPRGLDLYCDRGDGKFERRTANLAPGGPGTVRIAAWSSWFLEYDGSTLTNAAATNAFVAKVAADLVDWSDSGGQFCFAGTTAYLPSGFDDYCSVQVLETESPGEYRFNTRIYELPSVFLPAAFLVNGNPCEPAHLFSFTLTENMGASTEADANIFELDGTQVPLPDGSTSLLVQNTLNQFGHLLNGDQGLCYYWWGKYYAVHPDSPGGSGQTLLSVFTLTSNLASGTGQTATATVDVTSDPSLSVGSSITVYNTGAFRSYTGLKGLAIKTGSQWWIAEVDQHCLYFYGTLADNTHDMTVSGSNVPGSAASAKTIKLSAGEVLTPYPFSYLPAIVFDDGAYTGPTITNPHNFIGRAGDKVLVVHERSTDNNEIVDLFPTECRHLRFLLTEDAPNGLTPTIAAEPEQLGVLAGARGAVPASFNVYDKFYLAHNAKNGDAGHAVYNLATQQFEVVAITHTATVCKATASSTVTPADATFAASSPVGLNGKSPSGSVTVQNNGSSIASGAAILIRWDAIAGQWLLLESPSTQGIIDIRINGLTFEYTKDGVNWTPWHTGQEDCPAS